MEESKAESSPTRVPKEKTWRVTKALNFSSSSEEDLMSLQTKTANNNDEDCPCISCNDLSLDPNQKRCGLRA
ncbi:hypothetical protein JTB14_035241 [Gonioctena quinquepunctata]|nr:hypothetical protein JTB14_035241 [Gonioctena quinquepunctata]